MALSYIWSWCLCIKFVTLNGRNLTVKVKVQLLKYLLDLGARCTLLYICANNRCVWVTTNGKGHCIYIPGKRGHSIAVVGNLKFRMLANDEISVLREVSELLIPPPYVVEMITNTTGMPTSHTHAHFTMSSWSCRVCVCDVGMPVVCYHLYPCLSTFWHCHPYFLLQFLYSGIPLKRTPLGPKILSFIERCP